MPWLRSRTERSSGLTTWSVEWREGKRVRHRVLGPITEQEAQHELAALNAGKRTRQAKRTVDPTRAVEDYLHHLKASCRREGTVAHDRDKMKPLVDAWGHRPSPTGPAPTSRPSSPSGTGPSPGSGTPSGSTAASSRGAARSGSSAGTSSPASSPPGPGRGHSRLRHPLLHPLHLDALERALPVRLHRFAPGRSPRPGRGHP